MGHKKRTLRCDINFQRLWMLLDVHIVDTICGAGCIHKLDYILISGFHRAFLQSITFIIRLMHSVI